MLHWAASFGYDEIVELLLNREAKIHAKRADGSTALHIGAKEGHYRVVKLLLDRGAKIRVQNNKGLTPKWSFGCGKVA